MKKYWDIIPPREARTVVFPTNEQLIVQLYDRGVTVKDVFDIFYQLEEAAIGREEQYQRRRLTVEDAQLVGYQSKERINYDQIF